MSVIPRRVPTVAYSSNLKQDHYHFRTAPSTATNTHSLPSVLNISMFHLVKNCLGAEGNEEI